jgi:CRP-like cAMP-binding protein
MIEVAQNGKGSSFGELALIHRRPRAATIVWLTECHFGVLDKPMYQKVLLKKQKQELEAKSRFIQSIPFFKNWTNLTLTKFTYFFKEIKYHRNQTVFHEGDMLDSIYVVRRGEFEVTRNAKFKKEQKIPETSKAFESDPREQFQGRRLFNKPVRINHLMENNSQSPFQTSYINKRGYHNANIQGIWGEGIIMGEEDIVFSKKMTVGFPASSTIKCKSEHGELFIIKIEDLERETRTFVRHCLYLYRKNHGINLNVTDYWKSSN